MRYAFVVPYAEETDFVDLAALGEHGMQDVFRYDLVDKVLIRVTPNTTGEQGTGPSWDPAIIGNGDTIAFVTQDAPGDQFPSLVVRRIKSNTVHLPLSEPDSEWRYESSVSVSNSGKSVGWIETTDGCSGRNGATGTLRTITYVNGVHTYDEFFSSCSDQYSDLYASDAQVFNSGVVYSWHYVDKENWVGESGTRVTKTDRTKLWDVHSSQQFVPAPGGQKVTNLMGTFEILSTAGPVTTYPLPDSEAPYAPFASVYPRWVVYVDTNTRLVKRFDLTTGNLVTIGSTV